MLSMPELREKIKLCIQETDTFSTTQLKQKLKKMGYIYNVDYNVTSFSNSISSLAKQNYIIPLNNGKRGYYKIIKKLESNYKNQNTKKETPLNNELELKSMREEIRTHLKTTLQKIQDILDSEKPSTYGENIRTYQDILRLIKIIKEFEFTIKDT